MRFPRVHINLLIFIFLALSSCGTIPEKPDIWQCHFFLVDPVNESLFLCKREKTQEKKEIPISQSDGMVCNTTDDFNKLDAYIKELRMDLRRCYSDSEKLLEHFNASGYNIP